jgi:hypothetical protein
VPDEWEEPPVGVNVMSLKLFCQKLATQSYLCRKKHNIGAHKNSHFFPKIAETRQ